MSDKLLTIIFCLFVTCAFALAATIEIIPNSEGAYHDVGRN